MILFPVFCYGQLITNNLSIGCGYNDYYPYDTNGSCYHVNVNHQAVAMGQLMGFWNHPQRGIGHTEYFSNYGFVSTDYDYDDVPGLLYAADISVHSSFSTYLQAWQCGVITLDTINKSLHDHFGYKWGSVFSDNLSYRIQQEIALGRPVIAELYPTNNQCSRFVIIDGYNNGLFHFNFGIVSGPFFTGGWFPLNDVYVMGSHWNLYQKILTGIEPDTMHVSGFVFDPDTNLVQCFVNGVFCYGYFDLEVPRQTIFVEAEVDLPWSGVNATDALIVLKHFVGLTNLILLKKLCADVNNDTCINSLDAFYICKRFVGDINTFPAGNWKSESVKIYCDTTVNIQVRQIGNVN